MIEIKNLFYSYFGGLFLMMISAYAFKYSRKFVKKDYTSPLSPYTSFMIGTIGGFILGFLIILFKFFGKI